MNQRREFDVDRAIGDWLFDAAQAHRVDYLDAVLETTSRTRQRPAWAFPGRWLPRAAAPAGLALPRAAWVLLLLAALLALMAGTLFVGSLRRLPPPFGLAAPGLVALDADNHIAVMDQDGTDRRVLTSGPEADTSPAWSPDGTLLAFWRATVDQHWAIVIVDASGVQRARVVVQAPGPPPQPSGRSGCASAGYALGAPSTLEWSPDSSRLAFSQNVRGRCGIWVVGADGSGPAQIGDPTLSATNPTWSSDGTAIAFYAIRGASGGVHAMRPDGTGLRQISRVESIERGFVAYSGPQWQPGGDLVAFIAGTAATAHIAVVRSDGTGERDLMGSAPEPGTTDLIPRWSPDGTLIAYLHITPQRPNGEIFVANPDGSNAHAPPGQPDESMGGPMWSPDGRTVSALLDDSAFGTGLLILDLTGARPPTVVRATGNMGGTSWQRLAP